MVPPTSSTPTAGGGNSTAKTYSETDQIVLDYLKQKGMGSAVLELQAKLETATSPPAQKSLKEQLDSEEEQARNQRLMVTKATGGGFGYDLDAAVPIVAWGVPDAAAVVGDSDSNKLGVQEAQAYLEAFTTLQLWVLSLPDENSGATYQDPIAKARKIIQQGTDAAGDSSSVSLATVMKELLSSSDSSNKKDTGDHDATTTTSHKTSFSLPTSAKPELLAVTFALLVHTYCELLEVGMEGTAHVLRDAFLPIYQPLYDQSILQDLYQCQTTEDMVKLNTHNSQHLDALHQSKGILLQIASLQLRREEVSQAAVQSPDLGPKLQEYSQTIGILQQKYAELGKKASQAFDRMTEVPFLRRARAVRWQLTLSTSSYALLAQFLRSTSLQTSLLSMSTLLQTKCELHVEKRDPLPLTPAVVLDDNRDKRHPDLNETTPVNWAAPAPRGEDAPSADYDRRPFPPFHLQEEYEDEKTARKDQQIVQWNRALLMNGFRRLEALERKREFDTMQHGSGSDGSETTDSENAPVRLANPLEPSILLSTLCAHLPPEKSKSKTPPTKSTEKRPISSSSSFSSKKKTSSGVKAKVQMSASLWEEAGIGLTCAKLSPPDGRRIAVGCDDAAVRIWDMTTKENDSNNNQEVGQVLLGHKNGFPVFDVCWNRDGRSLLSCGGDGSVRLWDTLAQGPFGEVTQDVTRSSSNPPKKAAILTNAISKEALSKATQALEDAKTQPDMSVPDLKPESSTSGPKSGAALAVYRGHAPNTPVWSVAFAPSGYYFASAGGDATARLWVTDRPTPVRIFAGHTSDCVHTVAFHPNTNYILTGAEDKTARLWDIQTGRCVRLLNGCQYGIHKVEIDPSGQYAVGADAKGVVHLWDLGTGKKITEFIAKSTSTTTPESTKAHRSPTGSSGNAWGMQHALSFSACGRALATGGDDQCVRIWDVQAAVRNAEPVVEFPRKTFATRRTLLMDLEFTQRNLLLSVGKYISAVPLVNNISD